MPPRHILGSALNPIGADHFVIGHGVNDQGAWGAGFVIPLGKKFPLAKSEFLSIKHPQRGLNQYIPVSIENGEVIRHGFIANMCIQTLGVPNPLDYDAFAKSIAGLDTFAKQVKATVHVPRIGMGLAGGTVERILPMIPNDWIMYTLPEEVGRFPMERYENIDDFPSLTANKI
jgi:hypothetical protein